VASNDPKTGSQLAANGVAIGDGGVGDAARPYEAPLIGSMTTQAPIYSAMEWAKDKRIGYIRHGGKAPVDPMPTRASNCEAGWYHLLGGGYVCGKYATLDLNNPQVRLGTGPPNLDDPTPYHYAYNTTMGTPLYKSVPSREEMLKYEPYLKPKRRRSADEGDTAQASDSTGSIATSAESTAPPDAGSGGSPSGSAQAEASEQRKPWWQADFDAGKPEIKLSDMTEDADAIVAKRMVKGFFVAIDRTFSWNNRRWYKTTQGLVAPADRLAIAKSPTLQGIELAGTDPKQPVAFILSTRAHKYTVTTEGDRKRAAAEGPVERFESARLTGQVAQAAGIVYR
jgi:hypothetical protein